MAKEIEKSLGDQNTFQGRARHDDAMAKSLGEKATFAGGNESSNSDDGLLGGDDSLEVVDLASRYQIDSVLSRGGMGEVLLATDTRLKRKVAIKRILGDAARSRTALQRFLTEAQSIAVLAHPNIVQVYDYGRDKAGPFMIMEYVDGLSLLDRCRDGAMPVDEAVGFICQICDGLAKAHDAGIIHRDIKPANILLTNDGHPKLTDFGLAKAEAADTSMTMAGAVLGTLDFMPPEQRRDATQTDARSDLWSLAATLYQMVTGEPPRVIDLDAVPQQLRAIISQALKSKKEDRYQTARELKAALRGDSMATSTPLPAVAAAELGEGACASCRTQNDLQRNFCKKCAGALRVPCLKCNQKIPVWDQVCGSCGGKQPELVAAERTRIDAKRQEAESLAIQLAFKSSLQIAQEIAAIMDDRLQHQKSWAESFVAETDAELQRQMSNAATHFDEARKYRQAYDYSAAIHAVQSIPEPMRTREINAFFETVVKDHDELKELLSVIGDRIKSKSLDGLLTQVERAIQLDGSRQDLQKLRQHLNDREAKITKQCDDAFSQAEGLVGEGEAKAAFAAIEKVPDSRMTISRNRIRNQLQSMVTAEAELARQLSAAKADGVLDAQEAIDLLCATIHCLALNPRNALVQQLQADLVKRLQSMASRPLSIRLSEQNAKLLSALPSDLLGRLTDEVLCQFPVSMLIWIPGVNLRLSPYENSIGMQLKPLPAGTFKMGSTNYEGEEPHTVTLTRPFYLGVHEVTQGQYKRVMGTNPSTFKGPQNPVEDVSWDDAVKFCRKLSALPQEKAAGRVYRLPTEAEWEYACRAGSTTEYSFGDSESQLGEYAWYEKNSGKQTHPVGQKQPNAWGLYDMHGNVLEWCQDWHGDYPSGSVTDPTGPSTASPRVLRGGCWYNDAAFCRSAYRYGNVPTYRRYSNGFRLALSFVGVPAESGQDKKK